LKLAALEKRLEKTQEAFTLWSKVKSNVHNQDELHNAIIEGQNWWWKNCLYLSEEARDAFWESLRKASNHKTLLQIFRDESTEDNRKQMNENWQRLHEAGRTIALSVGLPSTSEQLGEDQKPE
ncbi:MAG: hypothetical protein KDD63_05880, partial [Bacteroidetes bacterium]|nr:hypothetical protein [Bacteroidota bacterium]